MEHVCMLSPSWTEESYNRTHIHLHTPSGLSGRGGPMPIGNGGAAHVGPLDRNHYQPELQGAELDDEDEDDETKIYEDMDDNDEHNYE